jgi:hypothetical protein
MLLPLLAWSYDGELLRAYPAEDSTGKLTTKATLKVLHSASRWRVFKFPVPLKDNTHAEIHPVGAPPNFAYAGTQQSRKFARKGGRL